MQDEGGFARSGKLLPLGAFVIGIEDERRVFDLFEEHHPNVRQPRRIDRGQSYGIGIVRLGAFRLGQPAARN